MKVIKVLERANLKCDIFQGSYSLKGPWIWLFVLKSPRKVLEVLNNALPRNAFFVFLDTTVKNTKYILEHYLIILPKVTPLVSVLLPHFQSKSNFQSLRKLKIVLEKSLNFDLIKLYELWIWHLFCLVNGKGSFPPSNPGASSTKLPGCPRVPDTSSGNIMFGGKNPSKELMDMCFRSFISCISCWVDPIVYWLCGCLYFLLTFCLFCCGRNGQAKWKSVLCRLCTSELHQRIRSFRREKASSVL